MLIKMSTGSQSNTSYTFYSNNTKSENDKSQSYRTLQLILDEKNKVIEKLKKQVHNQRIQLKFYIKKEMNSPLMVDFAKTCLPELTDENMTVALAINKFYKEMGLKSRMIDIYERVCSIASKTNNIIQTQEKVLGEVIENLRHYMNPDDIKSFLGNFDINTNYIQIFNSLLDSTLSLKRSMASFRTMCEKLISTEDKRNQIVEQVYSLPQEERTICNYLINIQMEKFELEHIIKQIIRKQKEKESCVDEIDIIEKNLKLLHQNIDCLNDDSDLCVATMLEKVYAQAMSLLTLSRQQREKYNSELDHLKNENVQLRELVQQLDGKKASTSQLSGADYSDIEKLHNVIKRTISEAHRSDKVKDDELKFKSRECEKLKHHIDQIYNKPKYQFWQMEGPPLSPENFTSEGDVQKKDSSSYKEQVETLLNIRDAYTELSKK